MLLGEGPGLQPVAGHLTTAVRLAPRRPLSRRWAVLVMNENQEAVDLTEPLIELLKSIDFAFDKEFGEQPKPQAEQERYAAALAAIGRFLTKIDPTHADRFFVLSDALADLSIGARPPVLGRPKQRSAPNPTQIEAAKANVAFALDALIALG